MGPDVEAEPARNSRAHGWSAPPSEAELIDVENKLDLAETFLEERSARLQRAFFKAREIPIHLRDNRPKLDRRRNAIEAVRSVIATMRRLIEMAREKGRQ